jgi:Kdo2-lipid IVA lauroyltransferase/acyltransferase
LNKKLGWLLEYSLLSSLYLVARLLDDRTRNRLARSLGRFIFKRIGFRRSVVFQQLGWAFPEMQPIERWDLGVKIYEQIATSLLEFMALGEMSQDKIRDLAALENPEILHQTMADGKGVILMTAHFGNFELLGSAIVAMGYPLNALVRTQSNPHVDRMQNKIRRRAGVNPIKADVSVRHLIRALRDGQCVAMLPDVNAGDDGIFVDFMGRQASTPRGLAYYAWKYNVPVIPTFIVRQPDGRHKVHFCQPIEPDAAGDEETATRKLTIAVTDKLEEFVRLYPDHWLWLHRRWKTRPPGESQQ